MTEFNTVPATPQPAGSYDLVVVGSGAAGLTAAVVAAHYGLSVLVLEKGERVGGTSAWSGGHVWIPNNPVARAAGIPDSEEEAVRYLLSLSRGLMDESLVRAFVAAGPEAIALLDEIADTQFRVSVGIPDYYPEQPGGKTGGGRTLETPLFAWDELGEWADRVEVSPFYANPHVVMNETPTGRAVPAEISAEEAARRKAANLRGLGQSLIARLLKAAVDRGVEIRTGHRAVRLLTEAVSGIDAGAGAAGSSRATSSSGVDAGLPGAAIRITGVLVEAEGTVRSVAAHRGVVLACGGFEWDDELKRAFLAGPLERPISIETNTGDGLRMAMRVGAALSTMREAFWTTVADLPEGINSRNKIMLSADRARPRAIIVNKHGERFANESANYNSFGGAFHQEDVSAFDYRNLPCWLIFDHEYLRRYGTVGHPAGETAPEWMTRADSLPELAATLGMPADALVATVENWNRDVADGVDRQFGRGQSAHDRWWGDPHAKGTVGGSLGPLDTPPFYAIRVRPGAMGTKGGPKIDGHARVLNVDGDIIPGLYAAGNAMGAPFGMTYGGAGGTLGPAITAGYLAASDAREDCHR